MWTYLFITKKAETKTLRRVHNVSTCACMLSTIAQSHGISHCTCKVCNEYVSYPHRPFPTNYTWQIHVGTFYHRGALLLPKTKRLSRAATRKPRGRTNRICFGSSCQRNQVLTKNFGLDELRTLMKASFVAPRGSRAPLEDVGLQSFLGLPGTRVHKGVKVERI